MDLNGSKYSIICNIKLLVVVRSLVVELMTLAMK